MSPDGPTVSVIIPTYNRAELVSRAIDSVLAQMFADFELLVVDDASTDDTREIVRAYDDERITYIRHDENTGSGGIARNTGLEHAVGEYVAFLDDDDRWLPEKLEKQVALLESLPERVGIVYCWMDRVDGDRVVERRRPTQSGDIFRAMLYENAIAAASTLLVRRSVIEEVEGFDPDVPRGIDSDFIRRVAVDYEVGYVPEALVVYDVGHGLGRDSDWDESGIRDAIESARIKFEKFPEAFERYPEMYAANLAYIGCQYGMLGRWGRCVEYFARGVHARPTARIPLQGLRLCKFYVDRHLPRLGRLIDTERVGWARIRRRWG